MDFLDIKHYPEGDPFDFNPDIFIAASGYESRSTIIPRLLENQTCRKVVFGFNEYSTDLKRPENDAFYRSEGFTFFTASGNEDPGFKQVFKDLPKDGARVMVDISVMTRKWYHSLLKSIGQISGIKNVILRVVYCPAYYSKTIKYRKSISMQRFWMEEKIRQETTSEKPITLILGLGIEAGVSKRIRDIVQPDKTILLHADPTDQKQYVEDIYVQNHKLITQIDIKDLIGYPLGETETIYKLLVNLVLPLRRDYQVVLVPRGPKIFTLIAMILQLSYPDIELAFPDFKVRQIRDRKPFSQYTFLDLIFGQE